MFHYSPKKFSALKEGNADPRQPPPTQMTKPSDTRWLAHDRSVKAIRCSMRPLIDTLEHIHEDTGEPEALGMLRTMKTYNFVATLLMLSDVLPVLTCLSRALQAKTADFTLVVSQLTYVQHSLQQIKERPSDQEYLSTVYASHRPCNCSCRSGDSKRIFQQKCAAALPGRGQQANQLSFQRYLGPLDCFQHLRSTEMPNSCPATAQIWHCRIGEAPKILWGDN